MFLPWIGQAPFSTRGEPREALVAQAMVVTGEWVLPRGYGDDVPSKPPFMHWVSAGVSQIVGGVSEFTARFPSACGAIVFALAFYLFLTPRCGERRAFVTIVVLTTSLEWFRAATICRVDMTLSALLAGALLLLFRWSERGLGGAPWSAILLLIGATLTKGPVSIVLPGLIFAAYLISKGESLVRVATRGLLVGVPVLMGAGLWYLLAYREGGAEFIAKVWYENVDRFAGTIEDKPHAHSAFYLYLTVFIGFIPWTVFLLPTIVRRGVAAVRGGISFARLRQGFGALTDFERFALLVVLGFLIFFSMPTSKRGVYLLPAYPFIAFWVSGLIERWVTAVVWRRSARVFAGVVLSLCGVIAAYRFDALDLGAVIKKPNALFDATFYATHLAGIDFMTVGPSFLLVVGLIVGAAWVFCFPPAARGEALAGFRVVAGLVLGLYLVAQAVVVPAVTRPLSLERVARDIAPLVPSEAKLYSHATEFYGVSFYLGREIYRATRPLEAGARVLVLERNRARLAEVLSPGQTTAVVFTSPYGVVKPRDRVTVVEVQGEGTAGDATLAPRGAVGSTDEEE
jgi:hypothetical protein